MKGWKGKILKIDLTSEKTEIIEPGIQIYTKYIGGKGLGGYFLKPHITEDWSHFEMPLIFMTGPLVGTPVPTSGRMTIMSRSPLTGTVGDTSAGGSLGTTIKKAGWDGIIITGRSKNLCGINIINENVELVDASNLAGREIGFVVKKLSGRGSSAVIGPAAENGVRFSGIAVDRHFFSGRNGLGLVMAEKKIKYIYVEGTGKTECFDETLTMAARDEIMRLVSASPVLKGELGISEYGTGALYDLMHSRRMMPTDNFRATRFSAAGEMNAPQYKKLYDAKKTGCRGCAILCKKIGKNNTVIPEFETMSHFSALINNRDINTVVEANRVCNELGMDTISAAATLACYAEINSKILPPDEIISLLYDIAYSRNDGALLKYGSREYSLKTGRPDLSITVKKQELPAYDPRGAYGMALAYATSTRGACHLRAYPVAHEILRKPVATDRFTFSGKARIIKINEDLNAVIDSLTACKFIFFAASLEEYARAFTGVTGIDITGQDLYKAGERIYYNDRIMNFMNGFSIVDDDLPDRFFNEDGSSGNGIEIKALNREEFLTARYNYYKIRGLDRFGRPLKEKCMELGLRWNS